MKFWWRSELHFRLSRKAMIETDLIRIDGISEIIELLKVKLIKMIAINPENDPEPHPWSPTAGHLPSETFKSNSNTIEFWSLKWELRVWQFTDFTLLCCVKTAIRRSKNQCMTWRLKSFLTLITFDTDWIENIRSTLIRSSKITSICISVGMKCRLFLS